VIALQYRRGEHKKELENGTFVYLLSYPAGYQMMIKEIISNPPRIHFLTVNPHSNKILDESWLLQ
jgi:hypothetical protein